MGLLTFSPINIFASTSDYVESSLKKLSYEERFYLRNFFRSLLKNDDLGHVLLFNTKPMCFGAIDKKCRRKSYRQKLLLKGWECWKKYEDYFPHPNFIFLEEEFPIGSDIVVHVFVINKNTLEVLLQKEVDVFKSALGKDFSAEIFLEAIQNKQSVRSLLSRDEALLGIVLGYGTESSMAYKEKNKDIDKDDGDWDIPEWTEDYYGVEARCPPKCKLHPIGFVGNPKSEEVKNLLNRYSWELDEIWSAYRKSKDPLKLVLEKLCEKV